MYCILDTGITLLNLVYFCVLCAFARGEDLQGCTLANQNALSVIVFARVCFHI